MRRSITIVLMCAMFLLQAASAADNKIIVQSRSQPGDGTGFDIEYFTRKCQQLVVGQGMF